MRLTEDQVRKGLHYPDKDVRFAVLQYFANSYSTNTAIMPDVIALVDRWGPKDAFAFSFPIADLAQTEETITWVIEQLQRPPKDEHEENFASHLRRLLVRADPRLVELHKAAILSSPGMDRKSASRLERRLRLASTPSDQLWKRLEEICEAGKGKMYPNEISYEEAGDIAEALARDVSQADRMIDLLKQEFDPEAETAMMWLEIFLVQMVGNMRYEPAVPILIKKLFVDGEILNEE